MTTGQPTRATMMRVGILLADHGQRVGAFEFGDRGAHGLEQIAEALHVEVHAVGDDFGVGLGCRTGSRWRCSSSRSSS